MTLFRFPEGESQRDAWVRAIRRENWMPNEDSRLCQLHFISGRPSRIPNNPDYVPTRFSFKSASATLEKSNMNRYERLQARRRKQSQSDSFEQRGKKRKADSEIQQVTDDVTDLCTGESSYHVELPSGELPACNVELLVNDVGLPTDNVELSTDNVELPTDNVGMQIPDNGVELPTDTVELPANSVELPASNMELTADNVELPADNVELPADNVELLADNVELPANNVGLPIPDDDIELLGHDTIVELLQLVEEKEKLEAVLSNTEKDLRIANEKITILEESLKSANEAAKRSDAKYEEAVEKLQKSEEEKILLMR